MGRLVPIVVGLLLASCAAALTRSPNAPADRALATSDPDSGPGVMVQPLPSASLPALAAPSATAVVSFPVGDTLASAQADFDCDGRPDRLEFFGQQGTLGGPLGDARTLVRLSLATGDTRETILSGNVDEPDPLVGVADVNGDGCADAIVKVGRGASTTWTSFLVYEGKELRRVEEDGKPVMFLFGGSVRHGNAIECRTRKDAPEIVARAISDYTSDFQWDATEDVHHWSTKSQLVLWSTTRSVILVTVRDAMPADQERYWGLSCGSVKLSG